MGPTRRIVASVMRSAALQALTASHATAQSGAADLFESYRSAIAKVTTIDRATQERSSYGSGFFVSGSGELLTNYHVIASALNTPDRYSLEIETIDGKHSDARIRGFDIVNDIALITTGLAPAVHFRMREQSILHGTRVFAFGNPLDLGAAIVEGTFNGKAERRFPERLHFTGSINSGMSGGPAVLTSGELIGVNVASYGDEVSLLVPLEPVRALLVQAENEGPLDTLIGRQLFGHDESLRRRVASAEAFPLVKFGSLRVPSGSKDTFDCWVERDEEEPRYRADFLTCSTGDELFVRDELETGAVSFRHVYLKGRDLNTFQFYSLFKEYLSDAAPPFKASRRELTTFKCASNLVSLGDFPFRAWQCMRAYRNFPGLYDGYLLLASLNERTAGLYSAMVLTGVSFDSYMAITEAFMERFQEGDGDAQ